MIGLTGPTGSGKSYVLDCWAARGVVPINADAVYHALLETDETLRNAIMARFETLDRKRLSRIVFADPQALRDLESITHPAVIAAVNRLTVDSGQRTMAVEAIKLFESGMDTLCAATVAVVAGSDLRLRRLAARDGRTETELRARMDAGKPADWYRERATYVLDGNSENLAEDAIKLLDAILCK
jgi:dephospho-CoA kinase